MVGLRYGFYPQVTNVVNGEKIQCEAVALTLIRTMPNVELVRAIST